MRPNRVAPKLNGGPTGGDGRLQMALATIDGSVLIRGMTIESIDSR